MIKALKLSFSSLGCGAIWYPAFSYPKWSERKNNSQHVSSYRYGWSTSAFLDCSLMLNWSTHGQLSLYVLCRQNLCSLREIKIWTCTHIHIHIHYFKVMWKTHARTPKGFTFCICLDTVNNIQIIMAIGVFLKGPLHEQSCLPWIFRPRG